jgi:hypothetical protein
MKTKHAAQGALLLEGKLVGAAKQRYMRERRRRKVRNIERRKARGSK